MRREFYVCLPDLIISVFSFQTTLSRALTISYTSCQEFGCVKTIKECFPIGKITMDRDTVNKCKK